MKCNCAVKMLIYLHALTACLPIRDKPCEWSTTRPSSSVLVTECPLRCRAQTFDPPLCRDWRQTLSPPPFLSLSACAFSIIHLFLSYRDLRGLFLCFSAHSLFFTLPLNLLDVLGILLILNFKTRSGCESGNYVHLCDFFEQLKEMDWHFWKIRLLSES